MHKWFQCFLLSSSLTLNALYTEKMRFMCLKFSIYFFYSLPRHFGVQMGDFFLEEKPNLFYRREEEEEPSKCGIVST